MSNTLKKTHRLKLDLIRDGDGQDRILDETPRAFKGMTLEVEMGLFENDTILESSDLARINILYYKLYNEAGDVVVSESITSFSAITAEQWEAGTHQNAVLTIDADTMNQAAGTLRLQVFFITTDVPAIRTTLVPKTQPFSLIDAGDSGAGSPPEPVISYYTTVDADARFVISRHSITSLTGGTGTDLDGINLTNINANTLLRFYHTVDNVLLTYRVVEDTLDTSSPWVIRPDNYASLSTKKVLKLEEVHKDGVPCVWGNTNSRFYQLLCDDSIAGAVTIAVNQTGITITD